MMHDRLASLFEGGKPRSGGGSAPPNLRHSPSHAVRMTAPSKRGPGLASLFEGGEPRSGGGSVLSCYQTLPQSKKAPSGEGAKSFR